VTYSFHPSAEAEFVDAIRHYEQQENGLGRDFAYEVYAAIERCLAYPGAWPILEGDIRRALVKRFPYGVLYAADSDNLLIVAIMHLHRQPGTWHNRI
jgi:plasmid stabilization system protein ParE